MPFDLHDRLLRSPRMTAAAWGGVGAAVLALSAMLPNPFHGPPTCLFHALTGIDCPSCGMTRAFVALCHGDVADAWRLNPNSLLLIAILLVLLPLCAAQFWTGRDLLRVVWMRLRRIITPLIVVPLFFAWFIKLTTSA